MISQERFIEHVQFSTDSGSTTLTMKCGTHDLVASAIVPCQWILAGFRISVWLRRLRDDHLRRYHPGLPDENYEVFSNFMSIGGNN